MYRLAVALTLLISLAGCEVVKKTTPIIPVEDFFRNPDKAKFKISPDGNYISWVEPWKNRLNIFVKSVKGDTLRMVTTHDDRDILDYFWANNDLLVYNFDKKGKEEFKLHVVDKYGSSLKNITPAKDVSGYVIDKLKNKPYDILVAMNKRTPTLFDVYQLNIRNGKTRLILKNTKNYTRFITDHDGQLRIAISTNGLKTGINYRKNNRSKFTLKKVVYYKEDFSPIYFSFDNKFVYVTSNISRDKSAIIKYDMEANKEVEEIYSNPDVDVFHLMKSEHMKKPVGVHYFKEKKVVEIFDPKVEAIYKRIQEQVPGFQVDVIDLDKEEKRIIVKAHNDKTPGTYYLYITNQNDLIKLADINPWLNYNYMADMQPVKYRARDGRLIEGYLTIPKGRTAKDLPLIVYPHGGPALRDHWRFSPQVQFFANRGYAVFQPNYRGSAGYGKEFFTAGFKQWGGKMQNDIFDGVKWLVNDGIVDPERVGVYGFSFGGYSALIGSAKPDSPYKCAVAYGSISNLVTFLQSIPDQWAPFRTMMFEMIGNPETDMKMLKEYSPVYQLNNYNIPMLIAHGSNDPRASKDDVDYLVAKLKKKGVPVEYIVKENEGHKFMNEENRLDLFRNVEKFFAKHLGGREQTYQKLSSNSAS